MRRAIVVLIILLIVLGGVAAISFYLVKDNMTVARKSKRYFVPITTIQKIEFVDTQTSATTAYHFSFTAQNFSGAGDYSVTLKNGHTYNVYISYYVMDPERAETHFSTTYYVNATAGQTAITRNFWYPYHP